MTDQKLSAKTNKELLLLLNYRLTEVEKKLKDLRISVDERATLAQLSGLVSHEEFDPVKKDVEDLQGIIKWITLLVIAAVVGSLLKTVLM